MCAERASPVVSRDSSRRESRPSPKRGPRNPAAAHHCSIGGPAVRSTPPCSSSVCISVVLKEPGSTPTTAPRGSEPPRNAAYPQTSPQSDQAASHPSTFGRFLAANRPSAESTGAGPAYAPRPPRGTHRTGEAGARDSRRHAAAHPRAGVLHRLSGPALKPWHRTRERYAGRAPLAIYHQQLFITFGGFTSRHSYNSKNFTN